MGVFDSIADVFIDAPEIKRSGFFPTLETQGLGKELVDFLRGRLTGDVTDRPEFTAISNALRDKLSLREQTGRQRISESATAGGFLDSGQVTQAFLDLQRSGDEAFASGVTQALLSLEQSRLEGVLPFLGAAAQEFSGVEQFNAQSQLSRTGMFLDFGAQMASLGMSGGGGGLSTADIQAIADAMAAGGG